GPQEPPPPRLQVHPLDELRQLHMREDAQLGTYGWVDRPHGIVRLPVDRAMALLAERSRRGSAKWGASPGHGTGAEGPWWSRSSARALRSRGRRWGCRRGCVRSASINIPERQSMPGWYSATRRDGASAWVTTWARDRYCSSPPTTAARCSARW